MTVLSEENILKNPLEQFARWYLEADAHEKIQYASAVCLSTVDESLKPDSRVVLLKEFSEQGFVFYTNLFSKKGKQLQQHPHAALNFYWQWLNRQVIVRGTVSQVSDQQADGYFASRPRGSQISAWASKQSEVLESRAFLEKRFHDINLKFENQDIPRPQHWSGLRLVPEQIEFWQEREDRLHDRFLYQKTDKNKWEIRRLYP
ncbi:pyridoxamine 5'-phosphate oxidase [candidate division KSB1 bacterium]|nr:pyridoxamine 5'-phosphate oxidase [candidate division KSB1 bacterium]